MCWTISLESLRVALKPHGDDETSESYFTQPGNHHAHCNLSFFRNDLLKV